MEAETILYVGAFKLPDCNAAAHRVINNAKALRELGYKVVLVQTLRNSSSKDETTRMAEHFGFECWEVATAATPVGAAASLLGISGIAKVFRNYTNVRHVVLYNFPSIAMLRMRRYCHKVGATCVADVTEWYGTRNKSIVYKIVKGFDTAVRMRFAHKCIDGLLVVSSYLENYYHGKNVLRVPPLVDIRDEKWNRKRSRNAGVKTLVYAGSPSAEKERLDAIVAAVSDLSEDYPIRLNIIGIDEDEFRTIYGEKESNYDPAVISFWGKVSHAEALDAVKSANFSLVIRDSNRVTEAGFPTKCVESITCGTAVIATAHPDISPLLSRGRNGVVVNQDSLGTELEHLITSHDSVTVDTRLFDYRNYLPQFEKFFDSLSMHRWRPQKETHRTERRARVALHIIMPNQVSGPNTANRRISESFLKDRYDFRFAVQRFHANSKINVALIRDLVTQFKEIDPDLVHLSGLQGAAFHAAVAARLAGCRTVLITIRGYSGDQVGLGRAKRFIFNRVVEPITLALCTRFYTVCADAADRKIVERYRAKFAGVIHNAAPQIDFSEMAARERLRSELHLEDRDFLVVVSGRMVRDKGIETILRAIPLLTNPRIRVVFVGDGPYYDIICDRHHDLIDSGKLFLLGKRADAVQVAAGSDLFLFATLHENLSNALLEAMSVGLPIVATRVGGNVEVVEDGRNGFLIDVDDHLAMAERINVLVSEPELRSRFSQESKAIIFEKFSQSVIYEQLASLYDSMLKR
ncbi:glycosyltransferase [Propionimicrobium sp. PCR01-08-3]|uniref:glycosyltransferase n=1 Tax=Propionimicrobium sp. PCR01-08-3 TaxID=3052086 RepID=UPI00255C3F99|nr:glycosyltransferase [Propionimicrobium sp. PCR01-08-3]WIY82994.1 glycosyltransferase [Propionimicrobium sp. PCR01-08-3]